MQRHLLNKRANISEYNSLVVGAVGFESTTQSLGRCRPGGEDCCCTTRPRLAMATPTFATTTQLFARATHVLYFQKGQMRTSLPTVRAFSKVDT